MRFWSDVLNFFQRESFDLTTAKGVGDYGELEAAKFLKREKGFRIICRNWKSRMDRRDELDIVAWDKDVMVFVEVRTRKADARVSGAETVNNKKKKILKRACKAYLKDLRHKPKHFRFDIVEVRLNRDETCEIHHFENVLLFAKHFHG